MMKKQEVIPISDRKAALRREMLEVRNALSDAYIAQAGADMQKHLLASPLYTEADTVFLYVSTEKEPGTRLILRHALAVGKRVCVPKCVNRREMLAVRIRSLAELAPGRMGIPEPAGGEETIGPEAMDLIAVPCVAASLDGKRLGHGAGYYDRFLARADSRRAVCLCFQRMLRDDIPMDEHDIWMPAVLTENGFAER